MAEGNRGPTPVAPREFSERLARLLAAVLTLTTKNPDDGEILAAIGKANVLLSECELTWEALTTAALKGLKPDNRAGWTPNSREAADIEAKYAREEAAREAVAQKRADEAARRARAADRAAGLVRNRFNRFVTDRDDQLKMVRTMLRQPAVWDHEGWLLMSLKLRRCGDLTITEREQLGEAYEALTTWQRVERQMKARAYRRAMRKGKKNVRK